jgi:hypothetical protein
MIVTSKVPKVIENVVFVTSKEGSIHPQHLLQLRQFKLSNDIYMTSEQLLMLVARIFKIEYEDLWNIVFLRSDRSDQSNKSLFAPHEQTTT